MIVMLDMKLENMVLDVVVNDVEVEVMVVLDVVVRDMVVGDVLFGGVFVGDMVVGDVVDVRMYNKVAGKVTIECGMKIVVTKWLNHSKAQLVPTFM